VAGLGRREVERHEALSPTEKERSGIEVAGHGQREAERHEAWENG